LRTANTHNSMEENRGEIVLEGEVMVKFGNPEFSKKPTNHYNLDVIISPCHNPTSVTIMAAPPSEHELQKACVAWFRLAHRPLAPLLFAVPNGGLRSPRGAARLKAEGVVAGVADLVLLVPRRGLGALCIEMKTERGRQSPAQREWQAAAERAGNAYAIVRSLDAFIRTVGAYLSNGQWTVDNGQCPSCAPCPLSIIHYPFSILNYQLAGLAYGTGLHIRSLQGWPSRS